jgi:ABC-2 type transport system ATP-binding protein
MLQFEQFRKNYDQHPVLSIDTMTITPGVYWIRGANGSGKSTLLKVIAGILHFNGKVLLNNIDLKQQPLDYRKRVNFAEAEPVFPEFLTGHELIALFAATKEAPAGQAAYFIDSMQMQHYLHRPIGTYSSGMLKKLSLVLAFLGKPDLILLDEPLITIDQPSLAVLYSWISRQHQEGVNFFLSSHQPLPQDGLPPVKEMIVDAQTLKLLS